MQSIIDYIPFGHENAISRRELARLTGLNDRHMRERIMQERRHTPILNMQDGSGYFRPDMNDSGDVALLRTYKRQEESRMKSIGWALKATRKALKTMGD